MEEAAFKDTELRFQRERETGFVTKYSPDILADATKKLAEAAKRRKKQLRKEARERELELGLAQSKDLQDTDDEDEDTNLNDNGSESSDHKVALGLNTDLPGSRRNSSMTPLMVSFMYSAFGIAHYVCDVCAAWVPHV